MVFYENKEIPDHFSKFSKLALWQLINRNYAKKFAAKNNIEFFYQGNGQGLVGAIGAIGYDFKDHTLELLSYRKNSKFGKERKAGQNFVGVFEVEIVLLAHTLLGLLDLLDLGFSQKFNVDLMASFFFEHLQERRDQIFFTFK